VDFKTKKPCGIGGLTGLDRGLTDKKTLKRRTVLRVDRFVGFYKQIYIYMRESASMYITIFLTRTLKKLSNLLRLSRFNTVQRFGEMKVVKPLSSPLSRSDNTGENNDRI